MPGLVNFRSKQFQQKMATGESSGTSSVVVTEDDQKEKEKPERVVLKLKKPKQDKKVKWEEGTVDNEFMDKKKSKCCCIYEKPKLFGESSSDESDNDGDCTDNCHGHKKKCFRHHDQEHNHLDGGAGGPPGSHDPSGASGGSSGS